MSLPEATSQPTDMPPHAPRERLTVDGQPSPRTRRRTLLVASALGVVLAGAGAIAAGKGLSGGNGPSAGHSVTTSPSSTSPSSSSPTSLPPSTTSTTTPPPSNEPLTNTQALAGLDSLRTKDAPRVAVMLDGRWVAQLSTKVGGITDPLQSTASGSHTFHWVDILQEEQALRQNATFGADVVTLLSTKFGSASTWQGHPSM